MDLKTLSANDLNSCLGAPVRLDVQKQSASLVGNVCSIDPITRSVVLAQYASDDNQQPTKIVWVPGSSIKALNKLENIEVSSLNLFHNGKLPHLIAIVAYNSLYASYS